MAKSWLQKYGTYEEEVVASAAGIIAFATGGQFGATQLLKKFNSVDTVAAANDSVKLVPALIGKVQGVFNNTANDLTVYPASGEYIDATINNGFVIEPGDYVEFRAYASGKWDSYSGSAIGAGTVTSVSVVNANGFFGTVATASTTPAITIRTTVIGILVGNGTSVAAAVAGDFPTLNQSTTGTAANVTGVVAIANGGTGQITATLGFNALSPVTTRGDIIVRGATNNQRLGLGAVGTILRSDGTDIVYTTATYPNTIVANNVLIATGTNVIGSNNNFKYDNTNNSILLNGATHVSEHISITQAASKYGIATTLNTSGYAGFVASGNSGSGSIIDVIGFSVYNASSTVGASSAMTFANNNGTSAVLNSEYISTTNKNFKISILSNSLLTSFINIIGASQGMGFGHNNTAPVSSFNFSGNYSKTADANAMGFRLGASMYTDTSGSTSPATMYAHSIDRPTLASSTASTTVAIGATLTIKGEPIAGTNISAITLPVSLYVERGYSIFLGNSGFGASSAPIEILDAVGNLKLTGQAYMPFYSISFTTTITPSWNNSGNQTVTLTDNITLANGTNLKNGATYVLRIFQGGSGSYTITSYGSQYKFSNGVQPTLTTTVGAYDDLYFLSNGTTLTFSGIINNPI